MNIQRVLKRMGLEVEFRDKAFSGKRYFGKKKISQSDFLVYLKV